MLREKPVAVLAATVLVLGLIQPPAAAVSARPPHPAAAAGTTVKTTITLVTGHKLLVTRMTDGKQSVLVDPPGSTFSFTDRTGDLHVIPRQAMPYLHSGRLDGRLFNVTDLIAQGYADRPAIPLIVSYPRAMTAAAVTAQSQTLRSAGATTAQAFGSADAVAVTASKPGFWKTALNQGATKIWLDGKVRASLDQSVPLVGAPRAWEAGYDGRGVKVAVLDTGYDAGHPDLAGKVVESRGFDGTGSVVDGNGHGTHVAATVAGAGGRRGVAPGARLAIGKVLDDVGNGDESWVLAGMEWAANSGAKVVSMSLGGGPSDGTDPLSQAVDSLTESTGALFVVAAGNSGPWEGTVITPGAATTALTVGNTDKSDQVNETSSRGPRLGDHAVKPEITAPGTDIVAARAAGTSLGQPVDEFYTSLTGTSMATPHVAGAAAILAQRHPDWTPGQLKSALVGSAHAPANGTVFEHGAGRLDVAAALDTTVTADRSTLAFGFQKWPNNDVGPITRTVGYRNTGSTPVTLDLSLAASHSSGEPLPDGTAAVAPRQLVVPAGGTASAAVTIRPDQIAAGDVCGMLVASGIRTPFSYGEESEHYDLTLTGIGRNGKPSDGWAMVWSERMGLFYWGVRLGAGGRQTLRLPKDDYMVIGAATMFGAQDNVLEETVGGNPQLSLEADRTVTFDARQGRELSFHTPRPARPSQIQLSWARWYEGGGSMDGFLNYAGDIPRLAIIPSTPVSNGKFEFVAGGRLVAPGYVYDLLLPTAGRLPASGGYRVGHRDLARIDTTFVGVGTDGRKTTETRSGFSPLASLRVGGSSVVSAPNRTDYVSAHGAIWESMVRLPQAGDEDVPTMWDNYRTYQGGSWQRTRWWGAPYSAGMDSDYSVTDAYRQDDRLSILFRDYSDGDPTHWGDSYWNEHPTQSVRSRFYRDGTLLADVRRGSFDIDGLPPEESAYRLVHTITRRGPIWTSSSYSESDWTFRSGHDPNPDWPPRGIPLLDLNWTIPTDAANLARGRTPFFIGLHARHVRGLSAGRLLPARLSISYDDGKTWRPVPLIPLGGDRYVGVLIHPARGWVSVRGEVRDTAGGSLRQTAIRAYALR